MPPVSTASQHASATPTDLSMFEPDQEWKARLRAEIEANMKDMVDQVRANYTRQVEEDPSNDKQWSKDCQNALKDLSRLAEEQFRTEVSRERNQRRWAAGIGVEDAWMGALREEQEAIFNQIKNERQGVAGSSPAAADVPVPEPPTQTTTSPPPLVPPEPELPPRFTATIPKVYDPPPLPAGLQPPPPRRPSAEPSTSPREWGGSLRRPKTTVDEPDRFKPPPASPWATPAERAASSASMTRPLAVPTTQLPQSPPSTRNSPYPTTSSLGRRGSKTSIKSNGSASSAASGRPPSIPERAGESQEDIGSIDHIQHQIELERQRQRGVVQEWHAMDKFRQRRESNETPSRPRASDIDDGGFLASKPPVPPRSATKSVPIPPVNFDPYGTSKTMRTALYPEDEGTPLRRSKSKSKSISRKASFAEPLESQPSSSLRKRRTVNETTFVDPAEDKYAAHPPRRHNTLSGLPTPPTSASRPRTLDLEYEDYIDQDLDGYDIPHRRELDHGPRPRSDSSEFEQSKRTRRAKKKAATLPTLIDPTDYAGGYRNAYDPRSTQPATSIPIPRNGDIYASSGSRSAHPSLSVPRTNKQPTPVDDEAPWPSWAAQPQLDYYDHHPPPPHPPATAPANRSFHRSQYEDSPRAPPLLPRSAGIQRSNSKNGQQPIPAPIFSHRESISRSQSRGVHPEHPRPRPPYYDNGRYPRGGETGEEEEEEEESSEGDGRSNDTFDTESYDESGPHDDDDEEEGQEGDTESSDGYPGPSRASYGSQSSSLQRERAMGGYRSSRPSSGAPNSGLDYNGHTPPTSIWHPPMVHIPRHNHINGDTERKAKKSERLARESESSEQQQQLAREKARLEREKERLDRERFAMEQEKREMQLKAAKEKEEAERIAREEEAERIKQAAIEEAERIAQEAERERERVRQLEREKEDLERRERENKEEIERRERQLRDELERRDREHQEKLEIERMEREKLEKEKEELERQREREQERQKQLEKAREQQKELEKERERLQREREREADREKLKKELEKERQRAARERLEREREEARMRVEQERKNRETEDVLAQLDQARRDAEDALRLAQEAATSKKLAQEQAEELKKKLDQAHKMAQEAAQKQIDAQRKHYEALKLQQEAQEKEATMRKKELEILRRERELEEREMQLQKQEEELKELQEMRNLEDQLKAKELETKRLADVLEQKKKAIEKQDQQLKEKPYWDSASSFSLFNDDAFSPSDLGPTNEPSLSPQEEQSPKSPDFPPATTGTSAADPEPEIDFLTERQGKGKKVKKAKGKKAQGNEDKLRMREEKELREEKERQEKEEKERQEKEERERQEEKERQEREERERLEKERADRLARLEQERADRAEAERLYKEELEEIQRAQRVEREKLEKEEKRHREEEARREAYRIAAEEEAKRERLRRLEEDRRVMLQVVEEERRIKSRIAEEERKRQEERKKQEENERLARLEREKREQEERARKERFDRLRAEEEEKKRQEQENERQAKEEAKKRREEEEREKLERFKRQQEEVRRQQEETRRQQEEFKRQQEIMFEQARRQQEEAAKAKEADERRAEDERIRFTQQEEFRQREEEIRRRRQDSADGTYLNTNPNAPYASTTSTPRPPPPSSTPRPPPFNATPKSPPPRAASANYAAGGIPPAWASWGASTTGGWSSSTPGPGTSSSARPSPNKPRAGSMGSGAFQSSTPHPTSSTPFSEADWARKQAEFARQQQERFRASQTGSSTGWSYMSKDNMKQVFETNERMWNALPTKSTLVWEDFPWPIFRKASSPEDITTASIETYLTSPHYPDKSKSEKDRIKEYIRRWHPDRFETKLLAKVEDNDKDKVREAAGSVVRSLNDLLAKQNSSLDTPLFGA